MSPSPARPTITSYYRHLCTAVKIRGALGRFIEVARCKGSLFYGAAEHQPGCKSLRQVQDFKIPILIKNHAFLSFFLPGAKTRRLLHSTLVCTSGTAAFTPFRVPFCTVLRVKRWLIVGLPCRAGSPAPWSGCRPRPSSSTGSTAPTWSATAAESTRSTPSA